MFREFLFFSFCIEGISLIKKLGMHCFINRCQSHLLANFGTYFKLILTDLIIICNMVLKFTSIFSRFVHNFIWNLTPSISHSPFACDASRIKHKNILVICYEMFIQVIKTKKKKIFYFCFEFFFFFRVNFYWLLQHDAGHVHFSLVGKVVDSEWADSAGTQISFIWYL